MVLLLSVVLKVMSSSTKIFGSRQFLNFSCLQENCAFLFFRKSGKKVNILANHTVKNGQKAFFKPSSYCTKEKQRPEEVLFGGAGTAILAEVESKIVPSRLISETKSEYGYSTENMSIFYPITHKVSESFSYIHLHKSIKVTPKSGHTVIFFHSISELLYSVNWPKTLKFFAKSLSEFNCNKSFSDNIYQKSLSVTAQYITHSSKPCPIFGQVLDLLWLFFVLIFQLESPGYGHLEKIKKWFLT